VNINYLLEPYQHFGINLGLERIKNLLEKLGNPHHSVPIIHVGGTNGKGSVCAYLSSILTAAGYTVGRYISPHLINWNERITVNLEPISDLDLIDILQQIKQVIETLEETPTQFEVVTAIAWLYFKQKKVDLAVMEVGLGGRLDATNVVDNPLVSVITSISLEHWQRLGPTLTHIATEKAGILKQNCPAVIGEVPPEAEAVFFHKIKELNCPTKWVKPAQKLGENLAKYEDIEYSLSLLGEMQLSNSALAIASLKILQEKGWKISEEAIKLGMEKTRWLGRLQWVNFQGKKILIDGAHNPAAAKFLKQYADSLNTKITWVMGMLSTKDHGDIFKALLRPNDDLYLVPVPDHSTANPKDLAILAQNICPDLNKCKTGDNLWIILESLTNSNEQIILCGSLYLIGHFLSKISTS
jgi:dihydrofolate synthase/folylpolyglutamate synthase